MTSQTASGPTIDWEAVGKNMNLEQVLPFVPRDRIVEFLANQGSLDTHGVERIIKLLLLSVPADQLHEMLQRQTTKSVENEGSNEPRA